MSGAPFPFGEPVDVLRRVTSTDRYNNKVTVSWQNVGSVVGCGVAPRVLPEVSGDGREGVTVGFTVFMPFGSNVGAHDRLVVRGVTVEVDGEPVSWVNPMTGWAPGDVVSTRWVEG